MTNLELVKEKLTKTNIILCSINEKMCDEWREQFKKYPNITVYNGYFENCMSSLQGRVAIATPANSYGLMDGGYDKAIIDYFGRELQNSVQDIILDMYCGEQPVGSSFAVRIPNYKNCVLIHTPTMRRPEVIRDRTTVYHCTRSALLCGIKSGCETLILPAFGAATGAVPETVVAYFMERAYNQLVNAPHQTPSWTYVYQYHPLKELLE